MGDPCGVGAEIVVKMLAQREVRKRARFVVFGLAEQLAYTADSMEIDLPFVRDHHESVRRYVNDLTVVDYDELSLPASMPRGPSKLGGQASMAFCEGAIQAALDDNIDALVTAPISKTPWPMAKFTVSPVPHPV